MQTVTNSDALARFGCALSDATRADILLLLREIGRASCRERVSPYV